MNPIRSECVTPVHRIRHRTALKSDISDTCTERKRMGPRNRPRRSQFGDERWKRSTSLCRYCTKTLPNNRTYLILFNQRASYAVTPARECFVAQRVLGSGTTASKRTTANCKQIAQPLHNKKVFVRSLLVRASVLIAVFVYLLTVLATFAL